MDIHGNLTALEAVIADMVLSFDARRTGPAKMREHARMSPTPADAPELIRTFLSEEQERLWLDFLEIHTRLARELDEALMERHRLSMSSFDILMRIAHTGSGEITISELAAQVSIGPSQVSRVVIELERRGLVERRRNAADARSTCAAITESGFAALAEAAPTYLSVLRERLFDKLSERDVHSISRAWARVLSPGGSKP